MNRTKIEETLKELQEQINYSVALGERPDDCSWGMEEGIIFSRREVENIANALTSLLAKDGGEVKEQAPSELRINDEYVLSDKGVEKAPSATVDADALFDKYSIGDTGNTQDILTKELFVKALTEALRGSYSREELLRNRITELESENVRLIKMIDGE